MKNILSFFHKKLQLWYYVVYELCNNPWKPYNQCSRQATGYRRRIGSRTVGKSVSMERLYKAFERNCCLPWTITAWDNHCKIEKITYTAILGCKLCEVVSIAQLTQPQNYIYIGKHPFLGLMVNIYIYEKSGVVQSPFISVEKSVVFFFLGDFLNWVNYIFIGKTTVLVDMV